MLGDPNQRTLKTTVPVARAANNSPGAPTRRAIRTEQGGRCITTASSSSSSQCQGGTPPEGGGGGVDP